MTSAISGRGDPIRTLELLWGKEAAPRRGPKPKYALAEVVAAAVEVADTEGLEALTTRHVAEKLGISPMSLYTYVPSKEELLDLMLDHVVGEQVSERPVFDPAEWRKNIAFIARKLWAFYLRHPWVLEFATHRPVLGPRTMEASEITLSALEGLGFTNLEMDRVATTITNFVHGAVRDAARERQVHQVTGMTDEQWWYRVVPFLETLDFTPYPVLSRVGQAAGEAWGAHDPEGTFTFGLERLLDGLELFITRRNRKGG